jgi:hypothetical protein
MLKNSLAHCIAAGLPSEAGVLGDCLFGGG